MLMASAPALALRALALVAVVWVLVAAFPAAAATSAASVNDEEEAVVIEEDDAGSLRITTRDPNSKLFLNGVDVLQQLAEQRALLDQIQRVQCTLAPLIDTTTLAGVGSPAAGLYSNAVRANNGLIYGIPRNADNVVIINPLTNTADTTTMASPALLSASDKWASAVLAPNGLIYGIPGAHEAVLVIDPNTNTFNSTAIVVGEPNETKWQAAALSNEGKIYALPVSSSTPILVLDTATNTASTLPNPLSTIGFAWTSAVTAPNNDRIYGVPYQASFVLILDPATNATDVTTIMGLGGNAKWASAALAPSGLIYGIPLNALDLLVINPFTDTADRVPLSQAAPGTPKWWGAVPLLNSDLIVGIPHAMTSVLVVDTATNATREVHVPGLDTDVYSRFIGGAVSLSNRVYAMPFDEDAILTIDGSCL
ncbi:hypothetical protein PTSG_06643 [Salpingoeca rosetta]|uniref:Uncharacterized protein n=1 Tax=Salpingoeca rosetta (strain ATCC 50818 / BSB-021) TaxID=946362 RepID=F2UFK6_SALR5|nr:uncharacterized protein PTSG_06643 [Salpingoeca rosetta]EGD75574.1 hypothetical protein PTSG_06643 [Salpingoeca rosetta]|eukprot:XP_004992031.1 hypothetical protein PTSG_06643 [Salpingoeca rosetta]